MLKVKPAEVGKSGSVGSLGGDGGGISTHHDHSILETILHSSGRIVTLVHLVPNASIIVAETDMRAFLQFSVFSALPSCHFYSRSLPSI